MVRTKISQVFRKGVVYVHEAERSYKTFTELGLHWSPFRQTAWNTGIWIQIELLPLKRVANQLNNRTVWMTGLHEESKFRMNTFALLHSTKNLLFSCLFVKTHRGPRVAFVLVWQEIKVPPKLMCTTEQHWLLQQHLDAEVAVVNATESDLITDVSVNNY